eukprot:1686635-Prorocentrum_lima.AAC.1
MINRCRPGRLAWVEDQGGVAGSEPSGPWSMSGHARGSISSHVWEALNPVKEDEEYGWSSPV